jgi:hypothetical protein
MFRVRNIPAALYKALGGGEPGRQRGAGAVAGLGDLAGGAGGVGRDHRLEAVEDEEHNTTRFVVLSREPVVPPAGAGPTVTSFMSRVRSPASATWRAAPAVSGATTALRPSRRMILRHWPSAWTILAENVEDEEHNTTRFVVLSREPVVPPAGAGPTVTVPPGGRRPRRRTGSR